MIIGAEIFFFDFVIGKVFKNITFYIVVMGFEVFFSGLAFFAVAE